MKKFALLFALSGLFVACEEVKETGADVTARQFAEAYYNFDFKQAEKLCTVEGRRFLVFRASNLTQEELDQVNAREKSVTAEVSDITLMNDSITRVAVRADIGDSCKIDVVKRDGEWLVKAISF